jgi:hypothetical protein
MADADTKLIFPGFAGFYRGPSPFAYAITRFATGAIRCLVA